MPRVRTATPDDLPAIGRLAAALVRMHHALDPQRFMIWSNLEEGYREYLGGELATKKAAVLVAVDDASAAVVGYAYGRLEGRSWNDLLDRCGKLHDVYVDERARRTGAGRMLVEAVIARLEELGAPRVVLATAVQNEAAQALFASLGFRRTMIEMTRERGRS